jgi:16S rRNA processing protein RimM
MSPSEFSFPTGPDHRSTELSTDHVIVGQIVNVHGVNGQLRVRVTSDVAHRFQIGRIVYINEAPFTITASRNFRGDQILLAFKEINDRDEARKFVEELLTVPVESIPVLPEGEWFHFQLLGLQVITDDGEELGDITEILETGSNDVYVVSQGKSQILIPALKSVINEVRLDERVMLVSLPDGLR